jgi:hypothetical protein
MAAVNRATQDVRDHPGRPRPAARQARLRPLLAEESVGWCGAAALLAAFALVSTGVLRATSASYLLLNLAGALGLAHTSFSRRAYPPAVLNVIWAVVAALSLIAIALGA